jgi:hypothetical protein
MVYLYKHDNLKTRWSKRRYLNLNFLVWISGTNKKTRPQIVFYIRWIRISEIYLYQVTVVAEFSGWESTFMACSCPSCHQSMMAASCSNLCHKLEERHGTVIPVSYVNILSSILINRRKQALSLRLFYRPRHSWFQVQNLAIGRDLTAKRAD